MDLWSKQWAFHTLGLGGRRELIPRVLELQTMINDGALFGIGGGQTTLFLVASVLALVLVLWMFAHSSRRQRFLHVAFGAILAGAAGNMYDRIFVQLVAVDRPAGARRYYVKSQSPDGGQIILRPYPLRPDDRPIIRPASMLADLPEEVGYVRDFIKIPTKVFGRRDLWPWVFNVADMLLVGGVAILALQLRRRRDSQVEGGSPLDSVPAKV